MEKEQTLEGGCTPDIYTSEKCCATVFVYLPLTHNSTPTDCNFFQSFSLIFIVLRNILDFGRFSRISSPTEENNMPSSCATKLQCTSDFRWVTNASAD
jgi:hypothetical protein